MDDRIDKFIDATQELKKGNYQVNIPVTPQDAVGRLGTALRELAISLDARYQELSKLTLITNRINTGLLLDAILEEVYQDFRPLIPYNRIGFSLLEDEGRTLRARWVKTDQAEVKLGIGYSAPMAGSSLHEILASREPRILNDLPQYLQHKPGSESTRLVVEEGYKSSLTCPLVANGVAVGFMFFSSTQAEVYAGLHVGLFKQIADQLSVIVEKGRLVSELAAKNQFIQQQNEELKRLNYLKNFFLGMAVHDLKNPITNIQLISDVMLGGDGQPLTAIEQRDFIKDINQQSRYMSELINDILSVAEIEAGQLKLSLVEFDLGHFLSEAVRRHRKLAEPKGTRIMQEGEPTGKLHGDPSRLRQVIDNLISNAVKYSPPGSLIHVRALAIKSGWRVEVQDEGPGILEKDRSRLFQDFARLSTRPTGGERSTGLGLAISRRMVEAHNGKIGADNLPGHGAVFWFEIP